VPNTLRTLAAWLERERRARQPLDAVRARQDEGARETVALARCTPAGGEHLGDAELERLRDLPLLSKAELRSRPIEDWQTGPAPPDARLSESSGTTGSPLVVPYAPLGAWRQGVLRLHVNRTRGLRPWSRTLSLTADVDRRPGRQRTVGRALSPPIGSDPEDVAGLIATFRPASVAGPARALIAVGRHLDPAARPRVVATFGESLVPENRRAVRELYGTDPADGYGMAEVGTIAWQCGRRDLYHVDHEGLVVEVVDAAGEPVAPGGTGEVVVTTLWNPLLPLVRYRTGDTAELADRPCACGHRLPCLVRVHGRLLDWLVDVGGRRVAPQRLWLTEHLDAAAVTAVEQYRVVQASDRSVRVEVVERAPVPDAALQGAADGYRALLGVPVEVVRVGSIEPEPSGRHRIIRSDATP
jgi:phenylacetate-CoA ligase